MIHHHQNFTNRERRQRLDTLAERRQMIRDLITDFIGAASLFAIGIMAFFLLYGLGY